MHDGSIVSYENPPVTEVVVAVAFTPIPGWTSASAGVVWNDLFSEAFPELEDRPPYEPPVERFGPGASRGISVSLNETPLARLWMRTPDGSELLQLQRDWFAANWVKVQPDMEYGRWPARRDAFISNFRTLNEYVAAQSGSELTPRQVEVTYINHIESGAVWNTHGELHRVMSGLERVDGLEDPEEVALRLTYRIVKEDEAVGRLHVRGDPVINAGTGAPAFRLNLTARGKPLGEGIDGVVGFAELGRERIVKTFDASTTRQMHELWGRVEG